MVPHILYSTNTFLKFWICLKYRDNRHHVWCSDVFDPDKKDRYSLSAMVPVSSNPAEIYRSLQKDVRSRDSHSGKIASQKASLKSLAVKWQLSKEISELARDEIVYMVENAPFEEWRPLIFVIPYGPVQSRVQEVPADKRAGLGPEFIIPDLHGNEFEILEV